MAALLVGLGVLAVLLSAALPTWRQMVQREREAELVFRGQQYARAIGLFQRKFGTTFPPNIDVLVEQRFLRKKYTDPVNGESEFEILYQASLIPTGPGQTRGGASGFGTQGATSGTSGRTASGGFGGIGAGGGSTSISQTGQGSGRSGSTAGRTGTSGFSGSGSSGQLGARGGVIGVASKNTDQSIRLYNGRDHYNEWQFVYIQLSRQPGVGGQGMTTPGGRGGRGGQRGSETGPGGFPGGFPGSMGGEAGGRGMRGRGGEFGQQPGQRGIPRGPGGSPFEPGGMPRPPGR